MSDRLPVLSESAEEGCGGGCDRRTLLQVLGIAGLASACRIDDPNGGDDVAPVDGPPGDVAPVDTGFEACGNNQLCFDLTSPKNAPLLNVGGFRNDVVSGTKRLIVIRTAETEFVTLSARCTHAGTSVLFRMAQNDIRCPNHGSQFNLDGSVKLGPAAASLQLFVNTFDMAGNLLTVNLI
jgi:cytochrome b6-f complex iron-sulfur subunit